MAMYNSNLKPWSRHWGCLADPKIPSFTLAQARFHACYPGFVFVGWSRPTPPLFSSGPVHTLQIGCWNTLILQAKPSKLQPCRFSFFQVALTVPYNPTAVAGREVVSVRFSSLMWSFWSEMYSSFLLRGSFRCATSASTAFNHSAIWWSEGVARLVHNFCHSVSSCCPSYCIHFVVWLTWSCSAVTANTCLGTASQASTSYSALSFGCASSLRFSSHWTSWQGFCHSSWGI